jgi:hypothetical protein
MAPIEEGQTRPAFQYPTGPAPVRFDVVKFIAATGFTVIGLLGLYAGGMKVHNDSSIAKDTRRIADAFEKMSREGRIVFIRQAPAGIRK